MVVRNWLRWFYSEATGQGFLVVASLPWPVFLKGDIKVGMGDTLIRGQRQHKYHYCGRCGVRYPLSQMVWQTSGRGKVLLCLANCYDTMTDIQRDAEITRRSMIAGQGLELIPDVKLTDGATIDVDDVTFVP